MCLLCCDMGWPERLRQVARLLFSWAGTEHGVLMGAEQDLAARLGQMALFSGLPAEALLRIAQSSVLHKYNTGDTVFSEGDEINSLLVVLEGDAAVFKRSLDGREQVLFHLHAGEIISAAALLLDDNACHSASGRACQATQIVSIPPSIFRDLSSQSSPFNWTLLRYLAGNSEQLSDLAGRLSLQSTRSRLAAFLIKQADQPGQTAGITQEEIAAEIGTVREIVARLLRDFAQAGWLERQRQRLVLKNRAALEEEAQRW